MKTILSYGMGIESSSLLVYWCENRSRLDFDLTEDLIAITAKTGDEQSTPKSRSRGQSFLGCVSMTSATIRSPAPVTLNLTASLFSMTPRTVLSRRLLFTICLAPPPPRVGCGCETGPPDPNFCYARWMVMPTPAQLSLHPLHLEMIR